MVTSAFRMFLDGVSASQDELDQVETISVDQEIDMASEARVEITIHTKDDGTWDGADQSFADAFSRIRVELRVGGSSFVPLIDGPVVGADTRMSSQPGQSTQIIVVHDDSAFLNRSADIERFDGKADHEVAKQLFGRAEQISDTKVEDTPRPPTTRTTAVVQRGTAMQILRRLARRQGMHAYVLPGSKPGKSVGVFRRLPTASDGLPDLVLLGDDRNVAEFHVSANSRKPSTVRTYALDVTDKSVATATSSFRNLELLGDAAALPSESDAARRLTAPGADDAVDATRRVQAEADTDSFAFSATGRVLPEAYAGVLSPYRVVRVRGVDAALTGSYVIKRVSHQVTRSDYTQSFELLRNAVAEPRTAASALGGIF